MNSSILRRLAELERRRAARLKPMNLAAMLEGVPEWIEVREREITIGLLLSERRMAQGCVVQLRTQELNFSGSVEWAELAFKFKADRERTQREIEDIEERLRAIGLPMSEWDGTEAEMEERDRGRIFEAVVGVLGVNG